MDLRESIDWLERCLDFARRLEQSDDERFREMFCDSMTAARDRVHQRLEDVVELDRTLFTYPGD